jgi:hypothetical protein
MKTGVSVQERLPDVHSPCVGVEKRLELIDFATVFRAISTVFLSLYIIVVAVRTAASDLAVNH